VIVSHRYQYGSCSFSSLFRYKVLDKICSAVFFYSMFARGLLHADDGYPSPKRENMYDFRLFALWFECQMALTCMVQDVRSLRGWGLSVCVGGWKLQNHVPRGAVPIQLLRHFCCRMYRYRLATIHYTSSRTDRRTDRRQYDDNSRSYCLSS